MNHVPAQLGPLSIRRESSELLKLALPLGAAQLANMLMSVTDTVMMGRIGTDALAAGGLGSAVSMLLLLTAQGLFMSLQPVISQARGARDESGVAANLVGALLIGLSAAIPVILTQIFADHVMVALGEEQRLAPLTLQYTTALAWGVVPFMLQGVLRNYVSAIGHTQIVFYTASSATIVNFFLNYGLIFGHWGLPRCGLAGAGYATGLSWALMGISFGSYAVFWNLLPHGLGELSAARVLRAARHLFRLGWPIAATWALEVGFFSGASLVAARLGTVSLAAHQICLNAVAVTFMVPLALGSAATIRVGYHYGARDYARVRLAGFTAIGLSLVCGLCLGTLVMLFRHNVMELYLSETDPSRLAVRDLGVSMLAIAAGFQLFDAAQVVTSHALRGLNDTKASLIAAVVGYWIAGLPLAALLAFHFSLGAAGIWWAFLISLGLVSVFLIVRFEYRSRASRFAAQS